MSREKERKGRGREKQPWARIFLGRQEEGH